MAYGIEVFNKSGKTLIDENSRQVQILKTGTMVPECAGASSLNPFRASGGGTAKGTIVSGPERDALIFVRPKRISGSRNGATLQFGVFLGSCQYRWTSTTATTVGQNFVYATPTVIGGSYATLSSAFLPQSFTGAPINVDHTAETIGDTVGASSNWASYSANSTLIVTDIEHHSGTTYKVYVSDTWSSSMPANTVSKTIDKTLASFHSSNQYRFDAAWGSSTTADFTLEYKMGVLTNNAEETAGYGVEVYKSNGSLAFSSNRENFQIKNITTGDPDLPADPNSFGAFDDSPLPIIYHVVDDPANFDDYWALVTVSGNTAAFVQGAGQNSSGSTRRTIGFSTGYCFVYPGNGFFDNRTMGNILTGGSSQSLGGSSNAGVAMAPLLRTQYNSAPQINQSSYVSDTHAIDATRSLVIGKFV